MRPRRFASASGRRGRCSLTETRVAQSLANLRMALTRLDEALAQPDENLLIVDGTIQRFEFVIELCWKALKRMLEKEGVRSGTPRETIRAAFAAGWLEDEEAWLEMLRDRNLTSHTYDEEVARKVYASVKRNAPVLRATYEALITRATRPEAGEAPSA